MAKKSSPKSPVADHAVVPAGLPLRKKVNRGQAQTKQRVCQVSQELNAKLKEFPEVNWSEVMRSALETAVNSLMLKS